jgi:hypothetical protein
MRANKKKCNKNLSKASTCVELGYISFLPIAANEIYLQELGVSTRIHRTYIPFAQTSGLTELLTYYYYYYYYEEIIA